MAWAVGNGCHADDRSWRARGRDRWRVPRPRRCDCPPRRCSSAVALSAVAAAVAVVDDVAGGVAVAASRWLSSPSAPAYAELALVSGSSDSVASPRSPSRGGPPVPVPSLVLSPVPVAGSHVRGPFIANPGCAHLTGETEERPQQPPGIRDSAVSAVVDGG